MRILITGATGFVGTTLIPVLYNCGFDELCLLVRNVDKAKNKFDALKANYVSTLDSDWRKKVIDYNPEIVIHLATYFTGKDDVDNIEKIISTNLLFTTFLLEALTSTQCKYFINTGTFTEFLYGAGEFLPNNLYSASKSAVRPIIQYFQTRNNWKWFNIIIYSPYGRKNDQKKVLDYMIDAFDSEVAVDFTKGEQILDFIHVDDIANFFVTLLQNSHKLSKLFYEFHLGTGKGHSVREVAEIMEKVSGRKIKANWGGREYSYNDVMYAVAPIGKNIEILDWRANIEIEEGLNILFDDIK